jgi:outer membrane lipoprotein-sorting protein
MRTIILALLLCLSAASAHADDGVNRAKLSKQDMVDLERIEEYLNELKSITANFLQIDDQGGVLRGDIIIQRPGKMRVTYDPPSKDFIVADGNNVHIWNDDLKEQTNVDEEGSLANFILRDHVTLSGDVVVTKFQRFPAKMEVSLIEADDPASGQLTLIFEDRPLKLRQWRVTDGQGHTIGVNLENAHEGGSFPASTFHFIPPNFGTSGESNAP